MSRFARFTEDGNDEIRALEISECGERNLPLHRRGRLGRILLRNSGPIKGRIRNQESYHRSAIGLSRDAFKKVVRKMSRFVPKGVASFPRKMNIGTQAGEAGRRARVGVARTRSPGSRVRCLMLNNHVSRGAAFRFLQGKRGGVTIEDRQSRKGWGQENPSLRALESELRIWWNR